MTQPEVSKASPSKKQMHQVRKQLKLARALERELAMVGQFLTFIEIDDDGSVWPLKAPVSLSHNKVEVKSFADGVLVLEHRLQLEFVGIEDPEDPDFWEVQEWLESGEESTVLGWLQFQQTWRLTERLESQPDTLALNLFARSTARYHLLVSVHGFAQEILRQLGRGELGAGAYLSPEGDRHEMRDLFEQIFASKVG